MSKWLSQIDVPIKSQVSTHKLTRCTRGNSELSAITTIHHFSVLHHNSLAYKKVLPIFFFGFFHNFPLFFSSACLRVLCSPGCQAMKCYHKKYFPSQFTHKSVRQRQRHANRVCGRGSGGRDGRWHRLQGAKQGFKLLLYVAEKVTNRVAIKFHMLITCVLATHISHTHLQALTTNGAPSKKVK